MNFCEMLTKDINFEPDCISPCCNTHGIEIPQFPFTGGPVDMVEYGRHIQKAAFDLQRDTKLCRGCPKLENKSDEDMDVDLFFRSVSINMHRYFCNCRCVYCDLWKHKKAGYGYDVLPAIKSLHEQNALHKNCFFSWGGGEPTILPTFETASAWILENGYVQNIHSNGLQFSPVVARLLKTNKGLLNISLDSASASVYHRVKGVNGFEKVLANLNLYAKNGNPQNIVLKYIIFEYNNELNEIKSFLNLAKCLNIGQIQLSLNFLETNGAGPSEKTQAAAAFFMLYAQHLELPCSYFFIDPKWTKKIEQKIEEAAKSQ